MPDTAPSTFDLVIIGGGPAGYTAAIRAGQLGKTVACIEKESALGGTCLRVGCIPSKALLESSYLYHEACENLGVHGIDVGEVKLDLPAMLKRKEQIVSMLSKGIEALFKKHKIERIFGHGSLAPGGVVKVIGAKGEQELKAKHILICTGSKVASLPGVEIDGERVITSTEALSFDTVPNKLIVIGAGFIGLELGSVWARLGSQVTMLEYLDRILPGTDAEVAGEALKIFKKQGLEFRLGCKVTSAKAKGKQAVVTIDGGEALEADRVLVSVGRSPNTENLGLAEVGIELDNRGRIPVNDHFATTAQGVYAIGDVIRGPMLAHKAEDEAVACVEQIFNGYGHVNYDVIPAVTYTHPEVAAVGMTEEQLKESGREYRKGLFPFRNNARARTLADTDGMVKVLADKHTDRILGVHILGGRAGDLIAEAAAAMEFGATSEDVARTCHAHPTLAEAFREACLAVDGRALNG